MTAAPRRAGLAADAKREALRGCALFKPLTEVELDAVIARSVIRRVERNERLMRQGDSGDSMMVVVQGRVRVSVASEDGQEISIGMLGPGEVLGEMALLDGGERSTTVTGVEDGVLLVIQRGDFLPLLQGSASLCLRLMEVLCGRLRRANLSMEEMATLDLSDRLGRVLVRLAESFGSRAPGGLRLDVKLSQKDLATLVAASREKVNRQLRYWEQKGAIARERGYLVIRRPEALTGAGD